MALFRRKFPSPLTGNSLTEDEFALEMGRCVAFQALRLGQVPDRLLVVADYGDAQPTASAADIMSTMRAWMLDITGLAGEPRAEQLTGKLTDLEPFELSLLLHAVDRSPGTTGWPVIPDRKALRKALVATLDVPADVRSAARHRWRLDQRETMMADFDRLAGKYPGTLGDFFEESMADWRAEEPGGFCGWVECPHCG